MENRVEEFKRNLPANVKRVIDRVLQAEFEKLDMQRAHGIIEDIKQIIEEEVEAREA